MSAGTALWDQLVWLWTIIVTVVHFFFDLLRWLAR